MVKWSRLAPHHSKTVQIVRPVPRGEGERTAAQCVRVKGKKKFPTDQTRALIETSP
jgi:hypothetical protein